MKGGISSLKWEHKTVSMKGDLHTRGEEKEENKGRYYRKRRY